MASLLDFFTGSGSFGGQQLPNSPEAASQGYAPNIFDRFGTGLDRLQQYPGLPAMPMDEEERRRQRLLTLAQLGSTVARGGTLAEGLQGVQQQGLQRQLFQMQLNEQQRKLLEQQQLSQRMAGLRQRLQGLPTEVTPAMALAGGGGPTEQAAQMVGQRIPEDTRQQIRADLLRSVASELALEPGGAAQAKALTELAQNITEVQKPTILSPGARAVSPTGRLIAEAPFKPEEKKQLSFEQRVLEDPAFANSPAGLAWLNIKKQIAAEGRPSITVQTGETFAKEIAKGAAGQAQLQVEQGQSSASQIENSNRVRALLDQGVITGFGAEGRLKLGQAAQALGFNQNDQRIANTATLIPQLAQNISEVQKPTVLSPGSRAVSATGRLIAEAPFAPKEPKQLSLEQAIMADPNYLNTPAGQAVLRMKQQLAEAAKPSITVQTGATFGEAMAKSTAAMAAGQVEQGQSAASQIENSNRVRALLDQGVITGFGAEGRLKLGQAAQALGFNQNDPRIANTATLIPQLAQRTLNNASKMKGVLSDSDILLLTKVSNADISVGEASLRQALDISDRVDREAIKRGRNAAQTILATPGMQQFAPLYQISDPKPYSKQVTVRGKSVTATQGTDGNYYVTIEGKRYRVEE